MHKSYVYLSRFFNNFIKYKKYSFPVKAFFTCNGLRAYHSGDLASWTEQGTIRIHGRIDNQIKLRGFRIELDEIEKVMAEFPQVESCAVKVLSHSGKSDYLAGYFTSAPGTNPMIQDITAFMKNHLPEYMIPTVMLRVDSMPQTVNGKIDRTQLPYIEPVPSTENYVAPRNESEAYVCKAFADVLHLGSHEKPWKYRMGYLSDLYDQYYAMSPYADQPLEREDLPQ